jgi:hypothetical protein
MVSGGMNTLIKVVVVPFGVVLLLAFTTEKGREVFSNFKSYFISPDAVRPQTGESAVDSHFNELSLNEKLNELDLAGRDLFGELHDWELRGYTPEGDLQSLLENNPVSPQVTSRWESRITDQNREAAEEVGEYYNHLRLYYTRIQWRVRNLEGETDQTMAELPDEARLDSAFKSERNLQQTSFVIRDMDRAMSILNKIIKPYFQS